MFRTFCCFFIIIIISISSCQRSPWNRQIKGLTAYHKNEFWYEWIGVDKNAPKAQVNEQVRIDYTLQKGTLVLDDSYDNPYPVLVQIPENRYDNFFTQALKLMAVGDSLRLLIPAKDIPNLLGNYRYEFGEKDLVTFTYKMQAIKDVATLQEEIQQEQVYLDSIRTTIPNLITKFYAGTLDGVQKTESGLSYYIFDSGTGVQANLGSFVSMHYICFSESGKIVDDSYTNMVPLDFQIGSQSLIEGWSEGAALLKQGGRALLFIPPKLAYGSQGNGELISPNSGVVFYIEMMNVLKK